MGSFKANILKNSPIIYIMNTVHDKIILRPIHERSEWKNLLRLYRRAFPRSERKPEIILMSTWRKGKADVWYAEKICPNGHRRFIGFAATLNGKDAVMLDYLAVSHKERGRGAGTFIIRSLLNAYRHGGFFVEIESVYEKNISNLPERENRRQFYIKNGFEPLYVVADVFGVQMELLGVNMTLDFPSYNAFYRDNYSPFAAKFVRPLPQAESLRQES